MTEQLVRGEFICVVCPNGCAIDAEFVKGLPPRLVSASGAECKRGKAWIEQEIEQPMRAIASNVPVVGGDCINASVRTNRPIPLDKIQDVMAAIRSQTLVAPVSIGHVVIANPAGADTDIIVTRNVVKV